MALTLRSILIWFAMSTPYRTFLFFPLLALLFQPMQSAHLDPRNLLALPLLPAGFIQYKLCGLYINKHGSGGPNPKNPPKSLVTTGPYRYVRNPMYIGHIIFLLGVALVLFSYVAIGLLLIQGVWLRRNAIKDEEVLRERYGEAYLEYKKSVPRWLPKL